MLTKQECLRLADEITRQLEAIREARIGICFHCGGTIYIDQERYEMKSGELIHARCMDRFVQSACSPLVSLPARKIHMVDKFSHAQFLFHTPAFWEE